MIEAPILHVNGRRPEAVVFAARLCARYRMKFHKDVVIDLSATGVSATTRPTSRPPRSR